MIFDTLANLELYTKIVPNLPAAIEVMDRGDVYTDKEGVYPTPNPKVTYQIKEFNSSVKPGLFEMHKNKTVLEIVLSGRDLLSLAWRENKDQLVSYDKEKDLAMVDGDPIAVYQGEEGRFAIFLPGEPYRLGVSATGESDKVKRITFFIED